MNRHSTVTAWLLNEVGLLDGVFSEDGTEVVGRPNAHNSAVLNVGHGSPAIITVNLSRRADWEAIKQRLIDEGYCRATPS